MLWYRANWVDTQRTYRNLMCGGILRMLGTAFGNGNINDSMCVNGYAFGNKIMAMSKLDAFLQVK